MLGPIESIIVVVLPILIIISFFSRRKKEFKVFRHHSNSYKAVKIGIAWLALPFMPIWFLFRGLWSYFFLYLFFIAFVILVGRELYGQISSFNFKNASDAELVWIGILIIIFLMPLFRGNNWTVKHLIKKGYLFQDTVNAVSIKNAISIVIKNNTRTFDEENDTQSEPSNLVKTNSDEKITLYTWIQVITIVVFILMILDGAELITTIKTSIVILAGLSGFVWLSDKAESSPRNFELGYALVTIIGFALLAVALYFDSL